MARALAVAALIAAGVLPPLMVAAQGVPSVDLGLLTQLGKLSAVGQQKAAATAEKSTKQSTLSKLHQDQLDALDATLSRISGMTPVAGDLENLSGLEASAVYPIEDDNPYAARLFGGAPETIEQLIAEVATKYAGHPGLAKAGINAIEWRCWFQGLIKQESNFSIGARSHVGAFGLTQIMPGTARELGIYPAYYDSPRLQLEGGARYVLTQLNKFGRMELALAAYNAGPGAVQKYGGIPPYAETQNYVVRIRANYNSYAARISGVDTLGTLDPADMRIAEASNIADAGTHYAEYSQTMVEKSLRRLREISAQIEAIDTAEDPQGAKRAIDLNTYARIEVTRIGYAASRVKAANAKVQQARYALLYAAYAKDEEFLQVKD